MYKNAGTLISIFTLVALLLPSQSLLAGTADLPLVDPSSVPQNGTFYLLSSLRTNADTGLPTWSSSISFNPFATFTNVSVDTYWLGSDANWPTDSFVQDDRNLDWSTLWPQIGTNVALRKAFIRRYLLYEIRQKQQQ